MSFAGYFIVRPFLFPCLSPIPGLIWFGSVYFVTTAGFVADQLMGENNNNNNNNCFEFLCAFVECDCLRA